MILSLEHITKSYGASLVLEDITAKIEDTDRIGFIGPNGAGKSTLLNILYGDLDTDEGIVSKSAAKSVGFLRQNNGLDRQSTIMEEMRAVFSHLYEVETEMRSLEQRIAQAGNATSEELTARYAHLQALYESREGYLIDVKIRTVLNGMGFLGVDTDTPIHVLSGGEKTRLALCRLLLEEPDLLILDEPTNHLDFKTLLWLEEYLQSYKGALLVVSHDRYFLDQLCTSIWALERHKMHLYPGNYSRYVVLKEERDERLRKEYEMQQSEIADMKDFIARNIVRASTTARAQSRQKALDRMELVERPRPPAKPASIRFRYKREPVKDVLVVENLTVSVGDGDDRKTLCSGLDFEMLRGEKIALIGHNGVGKSTFLKAVQGLVPHESGNIYWGSHTEISWFEQEELNFSPQKSTLHELWDRFPREYEHTIRTVLGNVGLTGQNVFKKVSDLSGGERARLKFAVLMMSCGNVLIMDEPTNHLDLATKEALDRALQDYTGTLLVVSHDRYLLNRFPDKIVEMHRDGFTAYKGNYDRYLAQKKSESAPAVSEPVKQEKSTSQSSHRTRKQRSEEVARKQRIRELEATIEGLEVDIFHLENETADPEVARDYVILQEKCDLLADKRLELNDCMDEWARLNEE